MLGAASSSSNDSSVRRQHRGELSDGGDVTGGREHHASAGIERAPVVAAAAGGPGKGCWDHAVRRPGDIAPPGRKSRCSSSPPQAKSSRPPRHRQTRDRFRLHRERLRRPRGIAQRVARRHRPLFDAGSLTGEPIQEKESPASCWTIRECAGRSCSVPRTSAGRSGRVVDVVMRGLRAICNCRSPRRATTWRSKRFDPGRLLP